MQQPVLGWGTLGQSTAFDIPYFQSLAGKGDWLVSGAKGIVFAVALLPTVLPLTLTEGKTP